MLASSIHRRWPIPKSACYGEPEGGANPKQVAIDWHETRGGGWVSCR